MILNICMVSVHGYVDPIPQLGRTDTGGQVVYVLELAKALGRLGHRVDIYTRWFDEKQKQIEQIPGYANIRIIRIPSGPWEFIRKERIYNVLDDLSFRMTEFIKSENIAYDLFHGHYVDGGIVAFESSKVFCKPFIFTPHSLGAWKRIQMGGEEEQMEEEFHFKHRISEELRLFSLVDGLLLTTELQRDKVKELYGWKQGDSSIIPPGVDINLFRPFGSGDERRPSYLPSHFILCLSRIDSNKGHIMLLNAFSLVVKEIPTVKLLIGGGSPNPQPTELQVVSSMRSVITDMGMENSVSIIGYVPDTDLTPSYQHAELFVLPSIFEPFGMTALEAMSCGKTVVASKLGGIREVIISEKNGVLVDPSNTKEFSGAMISVLKNPNVASRMGLEGRKTVEERFSWGAVAQQHLYYYKRFL